MGTVIRAWHFLYEGSKLRDGTAAPADGAWLEVSGNIILCQHGLHASLKPNDALKHAPGPILCLVECDGVIVQETDKLACSRRRIVARMDATEMLRYYARMQALSCVHLWPAPDVVLDYLMTGDESTRAAAWDAARAAAWDAAWAAARAAAWDAAWDAARDAAWAAARADFDKLVFECFADFLEGAL
jgi:hypothetical protein